METGKLFALLLNIGFLSTVVGTCTEKQAAQYFQTPLTEFGSELLIRISDDTDNHFVVSTLSLWTLLASITFSSSEVTLEELEKVLRLDKQPPSCFSSQVYEYVKHLSGNHDDVVFKRITTVFGDKTLLFRDSFRQQVETTGVTKLVEISFEHPDEVVATINEYVKSATKGVIDTIVKPADLNGAEVVFTDALSFKGTWRYQFMTQYTLPSAFYDATGDRIGDVNLIYTKLEANITDVPHMKCRVLELPYDNERFSMLFILPNKGVSVQRVVENMKSFNLHSILALFKVEIVIARIPMFQITTESDLRHAFMDMGLKSMFGNTATFPGMTEASFYVSNIIQKATIEVTEEGNESIVVIPDSMIDRVRAEKMFEANRPFLFMVVDKHTETVLFTGAYSKPTVF